jgi:GT2 family glycosyltransferase
MSNDGIAVVVLTHSRLHLLRRCVENVLARTSAATREIVIWNNASTDGTRAYLDALNDPRIHVVHHHRNIGQNAYAQAFALTSAGYLVELDDDVIDAPQDWDRVLLDAFMRLPDIGFLAANLVDDPNDSGARAMRERAHLYSAVEINGIRLLKGPVGGACAITSRELHDRVGGFPQQQGDVFYLEDAAYIEKIAALGKEAAFLERLRVHHAGGPYYAEWTSEKLAYWTAYHSRRMRKVMLKRLLLRMPFVRRLNTQFELFQAPSTQDVAAAREWYRYVP